ncbi:MAG: site-2 protease family protein [bacterium]|nr:site-2 protease family protein [bacterium]
MPEEPIIHLRAIPPQASPEGAGITPPEAGRPRLRVPLILYLLTCASTLFTAGPLYALGVMFILTAHEAGHYLQARRYRVPATLPYFLPMPLTPIGTMGAVIRMRAHIADRRALFDIAISGPLAGLVPAVILSAIGIRLSTLADAATVQEPGMTLGEPLLFRALAWLILGPTSDDTVLLLHPLAFAGWVGIFITALNLIPVGQLDGGHLLYALLRRKAHHVAMGLTMAAIAMIAIRFTQYWPWTLLVTLLILMGPLHPPTADDNVALGRGRIILGWITLLFVVVGFTPTPMVIE